jgi:agmatinase
MKRNHTFLGSEAAGDAGDRVLVVPVPIELSTSYGTGTARAPEAIVSASLQIELYNAGMDIDLEGSGIATVGDAIASRDDLAAFIDRERDALLSVFSCFVGGEHAITPWILEHLDLGEIGIVWVDAHADLRASYQGDAESHACAARNALAFGPIVQIGVRSYSSQERVFLSGTDEVRSFKRLDADARSAVRALPERVYLSIDYDGVDPSLIRAVGTPEPDGLHWGELMELLTFVFSCKTVVAMDAVELCPAPNDEPSNFIAAKVIYEAVSRHLAGRRARGEP